MDKNIFYTLKPEVVLAAKKLKGPIAIFGAGGFIGVNILKSLTLYRKDVIGISQHPSTNKRLIAAAIGKKYLVKCDLNNRRQLKQFINRYKPQTIFNLAAYGAYSKQTDQSKIYETNFISVIHLLEELKQKKFSAYVQAGSSSEYGDNSGAPKESSELRPNSHYAVSKVADYFALKYYGQVEHLPVAHLRLYSVYGPFEEPGRLIPVLLVHARNKRYPALARPEISRDFIYTTDVTSAFILVAVHLKKGLGGEVFNIGTGRKTTLVQIAQIVKKMCHLDKDPVFGAMRQRKWDHSADWYANIRYSRKKLHWTPAVKLEQGTALTWEWFKEHHNFYEKT